MSIQRITLVIIFWIGGAVFSGVLFAYSNYNMILIYLIILPGVLPFIPLLLPAPRHGFRWIFICIGIIIQVAFYFFDLLWGNLDSFLLAVFGISLLYYSLLVRSCKALASLAIITCVYFLWLLGQQLYLYNKFIASNVCFSYEEYCGSSCYKDYTKISCKTQQWQMDVFHGSPGSHYSFDITDDNVYVIFGDSSYSIKYLLTDEGLERQ